VGNNIKKSAVSLISNGKKKKFNFKKNKNNFIKEEEEIL